MIKIIISVLTILYYIPLNSECKVKNLNIREWDCKNCNNRNDRDINASINILMKGIEKYYKEQYVK